MKAFFTIARFAGTFECFISQKATPLGSGSFVKLPQLPLNEARFQGALAMI